MKKKLFVYLSLCIILCIAAGCTENKSSTLPTDNSFMTPATDGASTTSPTQSAITTNRGDDEVNDCKLMVNGKDITSGNYVKLNEYYADLPFTEVMEALGAKVEWQNKTTAKITYVGQDYILDTTKCSLIEVGGTFNIISTPPGSTRHYQVVGDEFILDNVTMKGAFQLMGTSIKININYDDKIVNIF